MSEVVEYYELRRVRIEPPASGEYRIATAAMLNCSLCGCVIDGNGGPGNGTVCIPCGDLLFRGQIRGIVKREVKNDG